MKEIKEIQFNITLKAQNYCIALRNVCFLDIGVLGYDITSSLWCIPYHNIENLKEGVK